MFTKSRSPVSVRADCSPPKGSVEDATSIELTADFWELMARNSFVAVPLLLVFGFLVIFARPLMVAMLKAQVATSSTASEQLKASGELLAVINALGTKLEVALGELAEVKEDVATMRSDIHDLDRLVKEHATILATRRPRHRIVQLQAKDKEDKT